MTAYDFDLFVIGGGSGGVRASRIAASLGAKVGLAERARMGGTCVNVGCVPKKLFVYGAHLAHDFAESAAFGWSVPDRTFDWNVLRTNTSREVERLNGIYKKLVEGVGVEILEGDARLIGEHTVEVRDALGKARVVRARHVLIATGSTPRRPSIPGAELGWVSDDLFTLEALPKRLTIVGAGYIGLEFAGIFAALGVQVRVVAKHQQVLPHFDHDVSSFVAKELEKQGIEVSFHDEVTSLERTGDQLRVHTKHGAHEASAVLFATGREPLIEGLGLDALGVVQRRGAVAVSEAYTTNLPWLHAVGDVIGHIQLTPVALAEGMTVARNLFGAGPKQTLDYAHIPTAVFTAPHVATVGLTESDARASGKKLAIYKADFKPMRHTVGGSPQRAFMKLVVCRDTDKVLGVHVVADDAGEMVQGFAVALRCGATKAQFDQTIGIHPTAAEELVTMRTASSIDN
jgi:glutathione reductase (NADPH)